MPFRALGLEARIYKAVQDAGYTEPTPIQTAAIPPILEGKDLIGIAQTGTGKTAAFVLPTLTRLMANTPAPGARRSVRALVIAPTRELVVQIEENVRVYARYLPLRMATVYGGVGERPQMEALRTGAEFIVATPGRLLDLMERVGDFSKLETLVLDEADRMLDMGFLPDIRRIVQALPKERQTLLFSASLSREIERLTREFMRNPQLVEIGRRANPAETVAQFVYEVPGHLKPALLAHLLEDPKMNTVLVFTRTKHGADKLARRIERNGLRTATLHSNRSQAQRLRALRAFKSGEVRVLVATDIAARGIDVDGISHVVNYDFPKHAEDYVHRIGRTGRAQMVGDAISFVTREDQGQLRTLERFIGRGIVRKRAENFDYHAPPQAMPPGQGGGHGQQPRPGGPPLRRWQRHGVPTGEFRALGGDRSRHFDGPPGRPPSDRQQGEGPQGGEMQGGPGGPHRPRPQQGGQHGWFRRAYRRG
jgi:ATP-dependent RNA helicase RhlE